MFGKCSILYLIIIHLKASRVREYLHSCVIVCSSFHLKEEGIFAKNHVNHGQEKRFNYQIKAQMVTYNCKVYYP